jgi:hypothetical protein
MVLAIRCHRQNMKTSIINGSEVSRLSVAIHASHGRLCSSDLYKGKPVSSLVDVALDAIVELETEIVRLKVLLSRK